MFGIASRQPDGYPLTTIAIPSTSRATWRTWPRLRRSPPGPAARPPRPRRRARARDGYLWFAPGSPARLLLLSRPASVRAQNGAASVPTGVNGHDRVFQTW